MLQYTGATTYVLCTYLGCVAGSAASSVSDTWLMRLGSDTAELPAAATWAASPDASNWIQKYLMGFKNMFNNARFKSSHLNYHVKVLWRYTFKNRFRENRLLKQLCEHDDSVF